MRCFSSLYRRGDPPLLAWENNRKKRVKRRGEQHGIALRLRSLLATHKGYLAYLKISGSSLRPAAPLASKEMAGEASIPLFTAVSRAEAISAAMNLCLGQEPFRAITNR